MGAALHRPDPPHPGPTGGARHTLGSSPESQEPAGRAGDLPYLSPAETHASDAEPRHTIHVAWWMEARRRAIGLDPALRALFTPALDHVEAGWQHVRPLQQWYDAEREHARESSDDYAQLLHFIDGDLVDLFRELAAGVAALVPGYDGWEAEADPGGVEGELDRFQRYFTLFRYAVESVPAPEALRTIARTAAQGLAGWSTELAVLVAAIEETVVSPLYKAARRAST